MAGGGQRSREGGPGPAGRPMAVEWQSAGLGRSGGHLVGTWWGAERWERRGGAGLGPLEAGHRGSWRGRWGGWPTAPVGGPSAAGDEGHHDVGGVLVEVLPAPVVDGGGPRVGVAGGDLDVAEGDPGVEGGHDEGRAQHVGVDVAEAGPPADGRHPAVGGAPVEALPSAPDDQGAAVALAHGQVDRAGRSGNQGDRGGFVALPHDLEGPVPTFEAQVLDVGLTGLGGAQPVQAQQRRQDGVGRVHALGGEQERPELGPVEPLPSLG